jgi:hypothetical protein
LKRGELIVNDTFETLQRMLEDLRDRRPQLAMRVRVEDQGGPDVKNVDLASATVIG